MKNYKSDFKKKTHFDGPDKYSKFLCAFKAIIKNELLKTDKEALDKTESPYV